jgi:hypothetical protein
LTESQKLWFQFFEKKIQSSEEPPVLGLFWELLIKDLNWFFAFLGTAGRGSHVLNPTP